MEWYKIIPELPEAELVVLETEISIRRNKEAKKIADTITLTDEERKLVSLSGARAAMALRARTDCTLKAAMMVIRREMGDPQYF